jgi:drug/metabolite transporter (DMT)-like permease
MAEAASGEARPSTGNVLALTAIAMFAFAANSLLCRLALGPKVIDPASFATIRVIAGAVTLGLIVLPKWRRSGRSTPDWRAAGMLFVYMAGFSFAYVTLSAGTGALILFGAVQLTMFAAALRSGEHFALLSWLGLAIAVLGLVYLVSPGITAPDLLGAGSMAVAGVAWGVYSLRGRGATDPLSSTANNFICAVPMVLVVSALFLGELRVSPRGLALAVASGAVTSGLGYVVWYAALRGLSRARAATVQLSVPVIAAIGGVLLLAEPITPRLLLASAATLGGVWLVLRQRGHAASKTA